MSKFGDELKKQRELVGKTMENVADISKLSQSYISQLESGKRNPSFSAIYKIIIALSRGAKLEMTDLTPELTWDQSEIEYDYQRKIFESLAPYFPKETATKIMQALIHNDFSKEFSQKELEEPYLDNSDATPYERIFDFSQIADLDFREARDFFFDGTPLSKKEFNTLKTLLRGIRQER